MDLKSGIKTTEFWLSLLAVLVGAFVASGILPSEHWAIKLGGIITTALGALGYSYSRSAAKSVCYGPDCGSKMNGLLVLLVAGSLAFSGCVTTSTGERKLDAAKAVDTACAITPALSTIAQKGVCENLAEPARTKCLRIAAIVQASAGVGLAIGGSIAEACRVPQ